VRGARAQKNTTNYDGLHVVGSEIVTKPSRMRSDPQALW